MTPPRDVRDLVGDDLPPDELARLERVHALLLEAGPPPELSPALAAPPAASRGGNVVALLPRRRRAALLLVAAAIAGAAFGGGYLARGGGSSFDSTFVPPPMVGTGPDRGAYATLAVGQRDAGGNWPVQMHVRGLPKLPANRYYVLYVSKGDRPLAACGSFRVQSGGVTTVEMSAAYDRAALGWDAWVVTVETRGQETPGRVVMVTRT